MSKGLLQALVQSKQDDPASSSLIAAIKGMTLGKSAPAEDQFKLPDLVTMGEGEELLLQEKELLKPPQQPVNKPWKYIRTKFNKEKIKIGVALQREQQRKRAEEVLQLEEDVELTQEEVEEKQWKEQLKKEWAERYARRAKEREEEEEEETEKIEDIIESGMQSRGSSKAKEQKKPCGGKGKAEAVQQEIDEEEEEYEERAEESSRKRRIGCINPWEAEEFSRLYQDQNGRSCEQDEK